jgi:hypothetical protein
MVTDAVRQIPAAGNINVFPNPAHDVINIQGSAIKAGNVVVTCYNSIGAIMSRRSESIRNGILNSAINVSHLPAGVYELVIQCSDGSNFTKQVIVQ